MAEIDADDLENSIRRERAYWSGDNTEAPGEPARHSRMHRILDAAEAHLASLRAPKGELEEARAMADMREWLDEEGSLRSALFSPISVKLKDYRTNDEWIIVGRNDHTALAAALSRARGEGA